MKKNNSKKQTIDKSIEVMKERMEAFEHIAKALEGLNMEQKQINQEKVNKRMKKL